MKVIATLTDRSVAVQLGDDGLWHPATDAPLEGLLADTLNIRSPRRSYMGCDGEHSHAYQEYAQEQAKAMGTKIELVPLPDPVDLTGPGSDRVVI